jgi:hypothetical protein
MSFSWFFMLEMVTSREKFGGFSLTFTHCIDPVCRDVNNLTGAAKHSGSHDTGNVIIILPFWGLLHRFLISLFQ